MNHAAMTMAAAGDGRTSEPSTGMPPLAACRATLEDGLLMVFGPEGDPLPPEVFAEAARAEPGTTMTVAGDAVPAARLAAVLEAQKRGRLVPAGQGATWLRSMLGAGPVPEEATSAELMTEDRLEVVRFARELVITTPAHQTLVLRALRPDDREHGIKCLDATGTPVGHDGLLDALSPEVAGEVPSSRIVAAADGAEVVLRPGDDGPLRLSPAGPDSATSVASSSAGDTLCWTTLAAVLTGSPMTGPGEPGGTAAANPPEVLTFDDHGFADLGWLADVLAGQGDRVSAVAFKGLPPCVRLSAGQPAEHGWRVGPDEIADLTMFATPENLPPFTLRIEPEGLDPDDGWSIPVRPSAGDERVVCAAGPLSVPLDFPPPFSARNRLEHFALVMIEGLPEGATLSAGVASARGRWLVVPDDLRDLRAHLPSGARLPCTLEAVGIAVEDRDGALSCARRSLVIGGDTPPLPDQDPLLVSLDLGPLLRAAGPDLRVDAVAITGLPPVVELSCGTHDRVSDCWVVRACELEDLALMVRDPGIRRLSLRAKAIAIGPQGRTTAISRTLELDVPAAGVSGLEPVGGPGFFRALSGRRP